MIKSRALDGIFEVAVPSDHCSYKCVAKMLQIMNATRSFM